MADDNTINSNPLLKNLNPSLLGSAEAKKKKSGDALGKDEFLTLLVTQLKNQDPMDPMKPEEFSVNLAQFSALEQLISINQKLGTDTGQEASSLAAYLGQQVTIDSDTLNVQNGEGGLVKFDLTKDVSNLSIDLLDASGNVKESIDFGPLPAGRHVAQLSGLTSSNGDYAFKIKAIPTTGGNYEVSGKVAGIVTGFAPGPDPTLYLGTREIKQSQILEVNTPGS